MAIVEGPGHILRYANPAFCRLFDQPKEGLLEKSFGEIMPKHDKCLGLLDRVFSGGVPVCHTEEEHSHTHPLFWSYIMWPVTVNQNVIGVIIQVTETAQFREKTLAMNEELILASVRQNEAIEAAEELNTLLLMEIKLRKIAEDALDEAHLINRGGDVQPSPDPDQSEMEFHENDVNI
jgi:nitrogen-specific signal transduction histidine kinase